MKRALVLGAVAACWSSGAEAAPCIRPDLLETWPKDGASGVPTNARLTAHYAPSAEYLGETIPFEHEGVGPETSTATFNANEGLLTVAPAGPLVASDRYRITWPALRGLTTAVLGKGAQVRFMAGASDDTEAPRFGGLGSIAWDIERENDDCTDSPQDRFRFDFALGDASDDGPRDLLTLVVFQTKGPNQPQGSPEQISIQRMPERGEEAHVRRAIDDTVGDVCFTALARDALGRVSNPGPEVCAKTVRPPFFYGCAFSSSRADPRSAWFVLAGLVGARTRFRRRRGAG